MNVARVSDRFNRQQGVAPLLLLFAMSSFSVLGIAALTAGMTDAPSGTTYGIVSSVRDGGLTKFLAPLVVPNAWRLQGGNGSYAFHLPVLVPDNPESELSTGAWHTMSDVEVPGMSVCCESHAGVCSTRHDGTGAAAIPDWMPGADDAHWVSLDLGNQPDSEKKTELITATILAAAREIDADTTPLACQLEFQGAIIAKGFAHLRQVTRQDATELPTDVVQGMIDIAVRTR
jgi:hypothetical protein